MTFTVNSHHRRRVAICKGLIVCAIIAVAFLLPWTLRSVIDASTKDGMIRVMAAATPGTPKKWVEQRLGSHPRLWFNSHDLNIVVPPGGSVLWYDSYPINGLCGACRTADFIIVFDSSDRAGQLIFLEWPFASR